MNMIKKSVMLSITMLVAFSQSASAFEFNAKKAAAIAVGLITLQAADMYTKTPTRNPQMPADLWGKIKFIVRDCHQPRYEARWTIDKQGNNVLNAACPASGFGHIIYWAKRLKNGLDVPLNIAKTIGGVCATCHFFGFNLSHYLKSTQDNLNYNKAK